MRGDLICVPVESCCGVLAHLARSGAEVCPVAQIDDRLMFLAADGSGACAGRVDGLPAGLALYGAACRFPVDTGRAPTSGCWVIPPNCASARLPSVAVVLSAVASAYAEYQAAQELKIV